MKKQHLFCITIFSIISVFSQNFRADIKNLKHEKVDCNRSNKNVQECANNYFTNSNLLLDKVYNHIYNLQNPKDQKLLKKSQSSWKKNSKKEFKKLDTIKVIENDKSATNPTLLKAKIVHTRIEYLIGKYIEFTVTDEKEVMKFVPINFDLISTTWGHLNDDRYNDCIIIIQKQFAKETDFPKVILLVGNEEGKLIYKYGNNQMLQNTNVESVSVEITQENFKINIPFNNNLRQLEFKFQPNQNNWYLQSDDIVPVNEQNSNKNTVHQKNNKISFEDFKY